MIRYVKGDLLKSDCEALVNTVNCVGVMGKGIALQFREQFPRMFVDYKYRCNRGMIHPGSMDIHRIRDTQDHARWIINFPTKNDWRYPSKLEWIESGLVDLVRAIRSIGIKSIAIPALGCANGGLKWATVKPLIESALAAVPDVDVEIYEPL